jgi:exopolysaccharide biosynthesis polyprenyl glycosylphosphotransferase
VNALSHPIYDHVSDRTREILDARERAGGKYRRGWLVRRALLTADLVGLITAFLISQKLFGTTDALRSRIDRLDEYVLFFATLPAWVIAAKCYGLYDKDEESADHSTVDDFSGVFHLVTVVSWLLYGGAFVSGIINPNIPKLLCFWALAVTAIPLARATSRAYCRRQIEYLQNTIIVGAGDVGQSLARKLLQHPEYGVNLVGFVDSAPKEQSPGLEHVALLGVPEDLVDITQVLDVEWVIIAFSGDPHEDTLRLIDDLRAKTNVHVDIVPRLFDRLGPSLAIHTVEGVPLLGLPPLRLTWSSLFVKRAVDLVVASFALIAVAPLMAMVAIVIRLDSPGPIFFGSRRVGRNGREFVAHKFRSMRAEDETEALRLLLEDPKIREEFEHTHKLTYDPRVTRVGRLLRRSSLDELPQLWNVIRGDISIVGARPITVSELAVMDECEKQAAYWSISEMRPGLTGYWQINGRSGIDYSQRIRLDSAYLTGWSIGLDLSIIAKTFRVLVARRGAV